MASSTTPRPSRQSFITPGRPSLLPTTSSSGLPTPTNSRRRKSSLGPSSSGTDEHSTPSYDDPEAKLAFEEAIRTRPPSSAGMSTTSDTNMMNHSVMGIGLGKPGVRSINTDSTYSTPPNPQLKYNGLSASVSSGLRTPGLGTTTPKTPLNHSTRLRTASSGVALSSRSSLSASTTTPTHPPTTPGYTLRHTSLAVSHSPSITTSRTPGKTPPARVSTSMGAPALPNVPGTDRKKFDPVVGDLVRLEGMGFEGRLRYKGEIKGKAGIFAGVELLEGFRGRGKNDGSVDGVRYFQTEENRGLFVALSKIGKPTVLPPRSASVMSTASSHISHTSHTSHRTSASLSISTTNMGEGRVTPSANGRATPAFSTRSGASGRETPYITEDEEGSEMGQNFGSRPLGQSSKANLSNETHSGPNGLKLTAGSRASMLQNMNATQLAAQKALKSTDASWKSSVIGGGTPGKSLSQSTSATPKARLPPRQSISASTSTNPHTPSRTASVSLRHPPRQSIGGQPVFATPKAPGQPTRSGRTSIVGGRMSVAGPPDAMPPTSPGKHGISSRQVSGSNARSEEVERVNAALLERIRDMESQLEIALDGLSLEERERQRREAEQRMKELQLASEFASKEASTTKIKLEEAQIAQLELTRQLEETMAGYEMTANKANDLESSLSKVKRDLEIQRERAEEELERGMEIKRGEVKDAEERLKDMEISLQQAQSHVMELTEAGQMSIRILESKVSDSQSKRFELEGNIRRLEDRLTETEARARQLETPPSPGTAVRRADTAAQIDNENLKAQVEHQKNKIAGLEDTIDELRIEIESHHERTLKASEKAKENERKLREDISKGKVEAGSVRDQAAATRARIAELEFALKESKSTLGHTQAEVESLRAEVSDLQNLRSVQASLVKTEKERVLLEGQLAKAQESLLARDEELDKLTRVFRELREKHSMHLPVDSPVSSNSRRRKTSNGLSDAEKSLRGFQHIIEELTRENEELQVRAATVEQEKELLRFDLTTLEAAAENNLKHQESQRQVEDQQETVALKQQLNHAFNKIERIQSQQMDAEQAWMDRHDHFVKEIDELVALVESKIDNEDDLKSQIKRLEAELGYASVAIPISEQGISTGHDRNVSEASQSHAMKHSPSLVTPSASIKTHTSNVKAQCILCQGDHELDDCPQYNGSASGLSPTASKTQEITSTVPNALAAEYEADLPEGATWCDNCDTSEHSTEECPNGDDIF